MWEDNPLYKARYFTKDKLDYRKVIAQRILIEMVKLIRKIHRQITINPGIGIPALIANVAAEEEVSDLLVTTIESGPWGGFHFQVLILIETLLRR